MPQSRQILNEATTPVVFPAMFSVCAYGLGIRVSPSPVNTEHIRTPICTGTQPTAERMWCWGTSPILQYSGLNIHIHSGQQISPPNSSEQRPKVILMQITKQVSLSPSVAPPRENYSTYKNVLKGANYSSFKYGYYK